MTSPSHRETLQRLFEDACDLPPADQQRFLDERCGGDLQLRAQLKSMLDRDRAYPQFLETPAVVAFAEGGDASPSAYVQTRIPEVIGRYRILGLLGEGGTAAVYLAQQNSPARNVALKILKPGVTSRRAIRGLEHEG